MALPSITPDMIRQPQDDMVPVANQKSWKNSPIVAVGLLLIIVSVVGFMIYAYMNGISLQQYFSGQEQTTGTPTPTVKVTPKVKVTETAGKFTPTPSPTPASPVKTNAFKGKYVTATTYVGWEIVEVDADTTITKGLTSIQIKDADKNVLASIDAIPQKGGLSVCLDIARFVDTDPTYITNESAKTAKELTAPSILRDYSQTPYVAYKILGNSVRRIGVSWFFDRADDPKHFHDACSETDAFNNKWGTLTYTNLVTGSQVADGAYFLNVNYENVNIKNIDGLDLALATLKTVK